MKILMTVENLVMDGVKRAATVLGNTLAGQNELAFYTLAPPHAFYQLNAPLITAARPADASVLNYFGQSPLDVYAMQITDLIATLKRDDYDAVILPGGLLTSFAPLIKAALPRLNVIAWMHNNVATYLNQYYVHMQRELKAGLMAADTVVTLTDSDLEGYSRFNPHTIKIYNPLTINTRGRRADLTRHTIAYTGRIDIQHKGLDYLLAIARELPADWQIAIAGQGPAAQMAVFERLVAELNVGERIIMRGALKDPALRAHYQQASIFMMTSRWEGMPLVMGEAMAFGLPVIAMENTGSTEYLRAGRYGVLTPRQNIWRLQAELTPLLRSIQLREHYGQQSIERSQDFQMTRILKQWQAILNRQYLPQLTVTEITKQDYAN